MRSCCMLIDTFLCLKHGDRARMFGMRDGQRVNFTDPGSKELHCFDCHDKPRVLKARRPPTLGVR